MWSATLDTVATELLDISVSAGVGASVCRHKSCCSYSLLSRQTSPSTASPYLCSHCPPMTRTQHINTERGT